MFEEIYRLLQVRCAEQVSYCAKVLACTLCQNFSCLQLCFLLYVGPCYQIVSTQAQCLARCPQVWLLKVLELLQKCSHLQTAEEDVQRVQLYCLQAVHGQTCQSACALAQERCDVRIAEGQSRVSGALYLAGAEHCALLSDAYAAFAHTNPMHTSVFPSVRRMEREVVAMTAAMLGGELCWTQTKSACLCFCPVV